MNKENETDVVEGSVKKGTHKKIAEAMQTMNSGKATRPVRSKR